MYTLNYCVNRLIILHQLTLINKQFKCQSLHIKTQLLIASQHMCIKTQKAINPIFSGGVLILTWINIINYCWMINWIKSNFLQFDIYFQSFDELILMNILSDGPVGPVILSLLVCVQYKKTLNLPCLAIFYIFSESKLINLSISLLINQSINLRNNFLQISIAHKKLLCWLFIIIIVVKHVSNWIIRNGRLVSYEAVRPTQVVLMWDLHSGA